ncbi:MAG TPA: hypothetical protein PK637_18060 [Flavobacteriales bacterium]|nr:hypothetical protein [Flavobacteriales bacterium]HRE98674.1 hypothetical protein [Flavobacteriales bacterium]
MTESHKDTANNPKISTDTFELHYLRLGYTIKGDSIFWKEGTGCLIKDFKKGENPGAVVRKGGNGMILIEGNQNGIHKAKTNSGLWLMFFACVFLGILFLIVRKKALKTRRKKRWR